MSVDEHRQQLEQDLRQHKDRADLISDEMRNLSNELKLHNVLLSLGRDENLLNLLDRLRDDEQLTREALEGGRSFFERQGIDLPPELRTVTGTSTGQRTELRGRFVDEAGREHEAVWNSGTGFSLYPAFRGDKNPNTNPDVTYDATRTQTGTDFTVRGTGFTRGGVVRLYILQEPGKVSADTHIATLNASPADGSFSRNHHAHYLFGDDPGTRAPAFVANDASTDEAGMEAVPSSYWYA